MSVTTARVFQGPGSSGFLGVKLWGFGFWEAEQEEESDLEGPVPFN